MKLDPETYSSKATNLGVGSALMIVSGYYGELTVTGDLTARWVCCFVSMGFFLYIVYELLVGLAAATQSESDPLSHVWHHCRERSRRHPDRLLRIGHHLQVWRWPHDLP